MVTRNAPFSSVFRWRARHQPSSAGPLPPPAAASHPRVSRSIGRVTPIRWLSPANNLPPQPSCLRTFVYTRISSAGIFFFHRDTLPFFSHGSIPRIPTCRGEIAIGGTYLQGFWNQIPRRWPIQRDLHERNKPRIAFHDETLKPELYVCTIAFEEFELYDLWRGWDDRGMETIFLDLVEISRYIEFYWNYR